MVYSYLMLSTLHEVVKILSKFYHMLNTVQSLAITLSIKTISLTSPPQNSTLSMLNHFFSVIFALVFFFLLQSQQNYLCFLCLFLCRICSIWYAFLLSRFLSAADPHYLTSLVLPSFCYVSFLYNNCKTTVCSLFQRLFDWLFLYNLILSAAKAQAMLVVVHCCVNRA